MLPSAVGRLQPPNGSQIPPGRFPSWYDGSYHHNLPGDYHPAASIDLNTPCFKLDHSFLPVPSDSEATLTEQDVRVIVFHQGDKHASPLPLFDSHRPIVRPTEGQPRHGRARSSSAQNIKTTDLHFTPHKSASLCNSVAVANHRRSIAETTPPCATPALSGTKNGSLAHHQVPLPITSPHSQSSQSSNQSIAQVLAASLSSLLSYPHKPSVSDYEISATASTGSGPKPAPCQRPTSPTLSLASRCSTPRNPVGAGQPSNSWHETPSVRPATPVAEGGSPSTPNKTTDHKMLAEMIDSLPMRGCQASVKIHQLKSPSRVMMTYNFTLYVRKQGRGSPMSDDSFCVSSCSSYGPETNSLRSSMDLNGVPSASQIRRVSSEQGLSRLDVPSAGSLEGRRRSATTASVTTFQHNSGHNHPSAQASPIPGLAGGRARSRLDGSTPGNRTPVSSVSSVGSSGYNSLYDLRMSGSDGMCSQDDEPVPMKSYRFAVIAMVNTPSENSALSSFLHTHWPLVMRHVVRIRDGIEVAVTSKKFLRNTIEFMDAQREFQRKLVTLWHTPRIESPVWLTLSTFEYSRRQIGCKFVSEFVRTAKEYINYGHDRFLPSVLTAVLSHHVGWVSSVKDGLLRRSLTESKLGYGGGDGDNRRGDADADPAMSGVRSTGLQSRSSSSSSLEQQLSEIHGALRWHQDLARTVVVGQSADQVAVLLYLLTFFIRSMDLNDITADLSRDCKDAAGTFMRSRTPLIATNTSHQPVMPSGLGQSKPQDVVASGAAVNNTSMSSRQDYHGREGTPSKACSSRTPLQQESNLYQTNLDKFTKEDCFPTPTNSLTTMTTQHSIGSGSGSGGSSTSHALATAAGSARRRRPANLSLPRDDSLEREESPTTPSIRTQTASPAGSGASSRRHGSFAVRTEAIAIHSQPPKSDAAGGSKAVQPSLSELSSSLQRHDAAKESASRDAHVRWLEWMANMESVRMTSTPGSPVGEGRIPLGGVFAPLHCNMSRSLLGGLSTEYLSDFVLHGTCCPHADVVRQANYDLKLAVQHSVLARPVTSAACIVASVDRRSCEVLCQCWPQDATTQLLLGKQLLETRTTVEPSRMVEDLVSAVIGVWDLGMSDLMCLLHLEDGLRQILLKGKMASEYLSRQPTLNQYHLNTMFGINESDMELLMSVNRVLWSPD